ncbi:hypothetical protein BC941DRAFT_471287 [Chlamydoabsidia padenii]|nr:hypothetical protein BC941DRAFT_471287 [Chlamydoabsidia padenii]
MTHTQIILKFKRDKAERLTNVSEVVVTCSRCGQAGHRNARSHSCRLNARNRQEVCQKINSNDGRPPHFSTELPSTLEDAVSTLIIADYYPLFNMPPKRPFRLSFVTTPISILVQLLDGVVSDKPRVSTKKGIDRTREDRGTFYKFLFVAKIATWIMTVIQSTPFIPSTLQRSLSTLAHRSWHQKYILNNRWTVRISNILNQGMARKVWNYRRLPNQLRRKHDDGILQIESNLPTTKTSSSAQHMVAISKLDYEIVRNFIDGGRKYQRRLGPTQERQVVRIAAMTTSPSPRP